MVTIDSLLDIAAAAEADGDARLSQEAMTAAQWLSDQGLEEIHQVGEFGGKTLQKGQKVRIKKGTIIRSMHPRYNRDNPKIAGRDYTITVYNTYNGYINPCWHQHKIGHAVRNSEVVWPGEGGYWCMVDTALVEEVPC